MSVSADAADVAEAMTEYAVSLRAAGHSLTKVAKMTGVPRGTVYYRIKRLTRAPKTRGRRRALETIEEASIRQWAADGGMKKLEDIKVRIKADFGKDVSLRTIRRVLDRSPDSSGGGDNSGAAGDNEAEGVVSAEELKLKSKKRAAIVAKVMTVNATHLQAEGQSLTEIAKTTGVARGTLYYRIQHLGQPQKRKGRRPTLNATEEASARLWAAEQGGKKLDTVTKKLKAEFGKDVSTRTLRRILDRDAAGCSSQGVLAPGNIVTDPLVEHTGVVQETPAVPVIHLLPHDLTAAFNGAPQQQQHVSDALSVLSSETLDLQTSAVI